MATNVPLRVDARLSTGTANTPRLGWGQTGAASRITYSFEKRRLSSAPLRGACSRDLKNVRQTRREGLIYGRHCNKSTDIGPWLRANLKGTNETTLGALTERTGRPLKRWSR